MNLSSILPPSDLLDKVRGVEAGLRQRKRLSGAGAAFSLLTSAIYLTVAFQQDLDSVEAFLKKTFTEPGLALPALVFIFSMLVLAWSRFWLREARQPFRYTCSIGKFEPIADGAPAGVTAWMGWMPHDVTHLLNDRVQRFFFAPGAEEGEPYIHVHGHWVVRNRADGEPGLEIEVMPRVRMGQANGAEVMAQATVLPLDENLDRKSYEELLEQVYHTIVSQVYQQLKEDVRTKIELLPTTRHRAIALLYEADDYARSNSLHAYEEAKELYEQAAALADPGWRPAKRTTIARAYRMTLCAIYELRAYLRRVEAFYRPSAEELDLLGARAMNGYGRMLVFRYILRSVVGQSADMPYEARPVAMLAVKRLRSLSRDVAGHANALFDAYVTLALAAWCVSDAVAANEALQNAARISPARAEEDVVCLLATAIVSADRRTRLGLLRRAVERASRFEVAQFWLAQETEMLWRTRVPFERKGAAHAVAEYEKVRRLNPRNLSAYSNAAYVQWLIGETDEAKNLLERALRLATDRQDLSVAELDYGLARIKAEDGQLNAAYRHYVDAVSVLSLGLQRRDFRSYWFSIPSRPLERRFRTYFLRVRRHVREVPRSDVDRKRISDSLLAFALNDLGEAHLARGGYPVIRYFDNRCGRLGTAMLREAVKLNPRFLLPYGTLATLQMGDDREALLRAGCAIEPRWPLGALMRAYDCASAAGNDQNGAASRAEAMAFVRRLLPHHWIWTGDAFDWSALTNRAYRRERRWARECNDFHAWTLQVLTSFYGEEDRERSLAVLDHLRTHFWSSDPSLLATIVRTTVDRDRAPEKKRRFFSKPARPVKELVDEVLAINPAAIVELYDMGVELSKEQIFAADDAAAKLFEEYRELPGYKERRAAMYASLMTDLDAIARAAALHPKHEKELQRMRWLEHYGVAASLAQMTVPRLAVECAPKAAEAIAPGGIATHAIPTQLLGVPFPPLQFHRVDDAPYYTIYVNGVAVRKRDWPLDRSDSPAESIGRDLEEILRERPATFCASTTCCDCSTKRNAAAAIAFVRTACSCSSPARCACWSRRESRCGIRR